MNETGTETHEVEALQDAIRGAIGPQAVEAILRYVRQARFSHQGWPKNAETCRELGWFADLLSRTVFGDG